MRRSPPRLVCCGAGRTWKVTTADPLGAEGLAVEPKLAGRHVVLRPVGFSDYEFLYLLSVTGSNLWRWRHRGETPSPELFRQVLHAGVLCQFVILRASDSEPVGLVLAYNPDIRNRHCYMAICLLPTVHHQSWPMESIGLFLDYVFGVWDFRKVYVESPEFNAEQFVNGARRWMTEEGRLREHWYHGGRWWDFITWALTRDQWMESRMGNYGYLSET